MTMVTFPCDALSHGLKAIDPNQHLWITQKNEWPKIYVNFVFFNV